MSARRRICLGLFSRSHFRHLASQLVSMETENRKPCIHHKPDFLISGFRGQLHEHSPDPLPSPSNPAQSRHPHARRYQAARDRRHNGQGGQHGRGDRGRVADPPRRLRGARPHAAAPFGRARHPTPALAHDDHLHRQARRRGDRHHGADPRRPARLADGKNSTGGRSPRCAPKGESSRRSARSA